MKYVWIGLLAILCYVGGSAGWKYMNLTKATTPKEFVEKLRTLYQSEDVDGILKMTAKAAGPLSTLKDERLRGDIEEYNEAKRRAELAEEFKRGGMWARAWAVTQYESEKDHGDHIHVTVRVSGVPSEIVLVREGEYLKIHPNPSSFPD